MDGLKLETVNDFGDIYTDLILYGARYESRAEIAQRIEQDRRNELIQEQQELDLLATLKKKYENI